MEREKELRMKVLKVKRRAGRGLEYVNGMESGSSPLVGEASIPRYNINDVNMEDTI